MFQTKNIINCINENRKYIKIILLLPTDSVLFQIFCFAQLHSFELEICSLIHYTK